MCAVQIPYNKLIMKSVVNYLHYSIRCFRLDAGRSVGLKYLHNNGSVKETEAHHNIWNNNPLPPLGGG